MLKLAIPLIHVANVTKAEDFYCGKLGFRREFVHRADERLADPCYMGITRDGIWVHVSSFAGDGVGGGVLNFLVDDVDSLHTEFAGKGVKISVEPVDQTWSTREMYVRDPDNNCIRFIQEKR